MGYFNDDDSQPVGGESGAPGAAPGPGAVWNPLLGRWMDERTGGPYEPAAAAAAPSSFSVPQIGRTSAEINAGNPSGADGLPYVQAGDTGGFVNGQVTIGEGRSITPQQAEQYYNEALAAGIPKAYIDDFLRRHPGDYNRIIEGYSNQPGGGGDEGGGGALRIGAAGGSGYGGAPNAMQPFNRQFTAPTMAEVQGSEPFKFRLGEAVNVIKRAGLASGNFLTNNTAKALQEQASGIASEEYGKEYGRRWNEYTGAADIHFQNEGNRYSSERTNRTDDFGIFDTNRKFDFGVLDSNRNFDRTLTNDNWGRGVDLWTMNRGNRQDDFTETVTIGELLERLRPRPA
jgi:hypothetical protein